MPILALRTQQKIWIAKQVFNVVRLGRTMFGGDLRVEATRKGIRWALDLNEGIDLAIYLFGVVEPGTHRSFQRLVRPGTTIIDIGANIGAHTLHLAKLAGPAGKVLAVEPTEFAWAKLQQNMGLNKELASRVVAKQVMLVDSDNRRVEPELCSSWPLNASRNEKLDEYTAGLMKSTQGAKAITLDSLINSLTLGPIDFIKIDVDGYEPDVLAGAIGMLRRDQPRILIEIQPCNFEKDYSRFEAMIRIFGDLGYEFADANTGRPYPVDAMKLRELIPHGASRNVIATTRPRAALSGH